MQQSIETRWYLKENAEALDLIIKWFAGNHEWKSSRPMVFKHVWERCDYYFDVNQYQKLSFKIREGRAEMKVLDKELGRVGSGTWVTGRVEQWIKWGFDLTQSKKEGPLSNFKNPALFTEVKKERLLLKYAVTPKGRVIRIDPESENTKNGCQVELTQIKLLGKRSYTFGFESTGEEKNLFHNFDLVFKKTCNEISAIGNLKLKLSDSYGYSQFLARRKQT